MEQREAEGNSGKFDSCISRTIAIGYGIILSIFFLTPLFIALSSTGKESDLYYFEIGDILDNSSLLIEVNSPMSSSVTYYSNEKPYTVLLSENMPSTITNNLPPQQFPLLSNSEFEYRGGFNYLGSNEPIYLLSGSSIMYNLTITSLNNTNHLACLYLFANGTDYNNFLMSVDNNNDPHCFTSAVTPGGTTVYFYSFGISKAGQYYVGIKLHSGVTVQANVSVLQIYYNTTGLIIVDYCGGIFPCSSDVCSTFICSHKATTYYLIKASNKISFYYYFTSPQLHGSLYGGFIACLVLGSLCCCCSCFLICCARCLYVFQKQRRGIRGYPIYYSCDDDFDNKQLQPSSQSKQESNDELFEPELISTSDEESLIKIGSNDVEPLDNTDCLISDCVELHDVTADIPQSHSNFIWKDIGCIKSTRCSSTKTWFNTSTSETTPQVVSSVDQAQLYSIKVETDSSLQPQTKRFTISNSSFTNRGSEHLCHVLTEKLIEDITNTFGELHKLSLDSSGLVYHCSQYGVTLIIPEGAVQESATVWFGACLFSDKFKFGDYVPVTPVVWVHIDRKLDKCAELYLSHDVVISSEGNLQQFTILTAHDDDCSDVLSFHENYRSQVQVAPGLKNFKISSPHFCSNCVAVQKRMYKTIPRRYLIARADKKNGSRELLVEFIFLCQQKGCKKVVEDQCAREGFKILSYEPVTLIGDGQASLSFEPHIVPGWKREDVGFSKDYISIEDIDYYQMMGCENTAEVAEDELERLEMLEDLLSYPPRFRIQFTSDAVVERSEKVIVRFNQVHPPVKNTILLDGSVELLLSPSSSATSTRSSIDLMTYANDLLLGDCLYIIASEGDLGKKWFDFGYRLGLTLCQLQDIGMTSIDFTQCTRKVIIHWRDQNRSESWEPIAVALAKIGFKDLAHRVKDNFDSPSVLESEPEDTEDHYKGVYCILCDQYHLKPQNIQQEVPNVDSPPDMVDLVNLVAAKIPEKFYQFGTAVRINNGFLKSLYDTYHDPMDRFIAVFNRWKDNDPDTYTWSTVIEVLQSDAIGAYTVAQDVTKHLTTNAAEHALN